jgi:prepilin-type processing-associated H-X9-DG protein
MWCIANDFLWSAKTMDENQGNGTYPSGNASQPSNGAISVVLKVLTALGILVVLAFFFLPALRTGSITAARRNACQNNLKEIALAVRAHEEKHGTFPPAYTTDADGKPLHSWRTLILPFLEEEALYNTIDLTKPWDDPVNAEAAKARVRVYECPANDEGNRTTYLAVVTPNSCLRVGEPRRLSDIPDGGKKTVMISEVDFKHAVPWMAPIDADEQVVMEIGPKSERVHPEGFGAAFVDGHVEFLLNGVSDAERRGQITLSVQDQVAAGVAK